MSETLRENLETPSVDGVDVRFETTEKILNGQLDDENEPVVDNGEEGIKEVVKAAMEEAKDIKPYDENGRVNGSEWAKALQIIDEKIYGRKGNHSHEDWEDAFEIILGKGQVVHKDMQRDGGSRDWYLKDGTHVFLNHRVSSNERGWLTVTHPDGTEEKFKPDGTIPEETTRDLEYKKEEINTIVNGLLKHDE